MDYGIGAAVGGLFNLGTTALQNKYNKEQAATQNQYNIDMWNRQNEYNSPSAQMQRLTEAGLNPNLAYGSVSTGNASAAPQQVAPAKQAPEMAKLGQAFDAIALLSSIEGLRGKKLENDILANKDRTGFFEANLLEDYYRSRVMGSQALEPDIQGDEVTVERRMPRSLALYYRRPGYIYSGNDTFFLSQAEQRNEYQTMLRGYENLGYNVDISRFRRNLLNKDLQFYIPDKVAGYVGTAANLLGSFSGGILNWLDYRLRKNRKPVKPDFHRNITNNTTNYYYYE